MLLTPRKRLLALLSVICLLPIISLIVTYQKITFASSILENFSPPSASYTSLDPLVSALSSPPTQLTPAQIKMSKVKSTVQEKIDAGKVVVFSKSYCPYCRNAKQLLKSLDVEFDLYELDQMEEGADWQNALAEMSGQRTVPNLFIGGNHVGGFSDLEAKHRSGELKKLLTAAE
ncbi:hypothetical protein JCM5353_008757 [Sporobolomyces roseus]